MTRYRFNFVLRSWRDLFEWGDEIHPFSRDAIFCIGPIRISRKLP